MSTAPQISVVVPVFNAEKSLAELFLQVKTVLQGRNQTFEIIFVDDYSQDGSWEIIQQLKGQNPEVRGIQLSRNFGQHNATFCGVCKANGDIVITIDDDLESSPKDIPVLLDKMQQTGCDLVYADFTNASRGFLRSIFTGLYKFGTRKIEGKNQGRGSSFRVMNRNLVEKLKTHFNEFVFLDELILWHTRHIEFVKMLKQPSARGKSSYTIFDLSLMTGELMLFSTVFPLRMVTVIGGTLASVNFVLGLYYIIKKVFLSVEVEGYTSLIVSILFSTGLILLALGIIAEYLSKIVKSQYGKPAYSIHREI